MWLFLQTLEDADEVGLLDGLEHPDAGRAEIGYALEDGCCSKVAACVEDATVFVDTFDIDAQLLYEDVYLLFT